LAKSCACFTFPQCGTGHTSEQKSCLSQHHPSLIRSFVVITMEETAWKMDTPISRVFCYLIREINFSQFWILGSICLWGPYASSPCAESKDVSVVGVWK
jgi:hypothetical protein